jgi:hypothetical protein
VAAVHAYIAWAFFERQLSAKTIDAYLFGITFQWRSWGRNCDFMSSFPIVKARSALGIRCRQRRTVHGRRSRTTQPVSRAMIQQYARDCGTQDAVHHCIHTALLTAFSLLLRVSEYTISRRTKHHLRASDVSFRVKGSLIPSHLISSTLDPADLTEVVIKLRSSKTDQAGSGSIFCVPRRPAAAPIDDLPTVLWSWACRAGLTEHDPFFSCRNAIRPWVLRREDISVALKRIAIAAGFPPEYFVPHSLRYGGASAMAAAGLPDHTIQTFGRWRSMTFLQYIKLSTSLVDSVQRALALHPGLSHGDIANLLM